MCPILHRFCVESYCTETAYTVNRDSKCCKFQAFVSITYTEFNIPVTLKIHI